MPKTKAQSNKNHYAKSTHTNQTDYQNVICKVVTESHNKKAKFPNVQAIMFFLEHRQPAHLTDTIFKIGTVLWNVTYKKIFM